MENPARRWTAIATTVIICGMVFSVGSAAEKAHAVFPPLQIFKDLCLDTPWSIQAIAELSKKNGYAPVSAEDVPLPDGKVGHLINWEAKTAVGPVAILTFEASSETRGYTSTCSVSAPTNSMEFVRGWLTNSFGSPTSSLEKASNASEIHWTDISDGMKIDVILLTKMPDHDYALLTVMKHRDVPKSPGDDK